MINDNQGIPHFTENEREQLADIGQGVVDAEIKNGLKMKNPMTRKALVTVGAAAIATALGFIAKAFV